MVKSGIYDQIPTIW